MDRGTQNNISTINKSYVLPQTPQLLSNNFEKTGGAINFVLLNGDAPSYGAYISCFICSTTKRPNYSQATLRKPKGQSIFFIEWWSPIIWCLHFSLHMVYHKATHLQSNIFEKTGGAINLSCYWLVTPHHMVLTFLCWSLCTPML